MIVQIPKRTSWKGVNWTSEFDQVHFSNVYMILSAVFMFIPIFNIIFGVIGQKKYPKKVCKKCDHYRRTCMAAWIIGVIEVVIALIILAIIAKSYKDKFEQADKMSEISFGIGRDMADKHL